MNKLQRLLNKLACFLLVISLTVEIAGFFVDSTKLVWIAFVILITASALGIKADEIKKSNN